MDRCKVEDYFCKSHTVDKEAEIDVHQNLTVLSKLVFALKVACEIHLTRDVTGQHYRPVPSDVSLPRRLKFRLTIDKITLKLKET